MISYNLFTLLTFSESAYSMEYIVDLNPGTSVIKKQGLQSRRILYYQFKVLFHICFNVV